MEKKRRQFMHIIKAFYGLLFTAGIAISLPAKSHKCGLEGDIERQVKAIMLAFKAKYKNDPVVQAILNRDFEGVSSTTINGNPLLEVKVPVYQNSYARVTCDYIALAFGSVMFEPFKPNTPESTRFYKLIKTLIAKGVTTRGKYSWKLFAKRVNGFALADSERGVIGSNVNAMDKGFAPLASLFKP
jgi:hypothetical protein